MINKPPTYGKGEPPREGSKSLGRRCHFDEVEGALFMSQKVGRAECIVLTKTSLGFARQHRVQLKSTLPKNGCARRVPSVSPSTLPTLATTILRAR